MPQNKETARRFCREKQLDTVDLFIHLGSCITTKGVAERDIGKARSVFISQFLENNSVFKEDQA